MTDPCPICQRVHDRAVYRRESRIVDPDGRPYIIEEEQETTGCAMYHAKRLYEDYAREMMDKEPALLEKFLGPPTLYGPEGKRLTVEDGLTPEPEFIWDGSGKHFSVPYSAPPISDEETAGE